jgi:DNA invertase Pin-like site-specific DNA recombinase
VQKVVFTKKKTSYNHLMIYGYARVSTADQTIAPQVDALNKVVEIVFSDEATSGTIKGRERPGFARLLLALSPGDTLVVVRLDRLGRSVVDVLQQVEALTARGIVVRSLAEGVDSSTPAGRMVLGVMASLAAYERELTRERQTAGISSAKSRGKHLGRPHALNLAQKEHASALRELGKGPKEIGRLLGCSESTVRRALLI